MDFQISMLNFNDFIPLQIYRERSDKDYDVAGDVVRKGFASIKNKFGM